MPQSLQRLLLWPHSGRAQCCNWQQGYCGVARRLSLFSQTVSLALHLQRWITIHLSLSADCCCDAAFPSCCEALGEAMASLMLVRVSQWICISGTLHLVSVVASSSKNLTECTCCKAQKSLYSLLGA